MYYIADLLFTNIFENLTSERYKMVVLEKHPSAFVSNRPEEHFYRPKNR